jgi:hypothetical protein
MSQSSYLSGGERVNNHTDAEIIDGETQMGHWQNGAKGQYGTDN